MSTLPLTPDEVLATTRAVRKRLDFDRPVPDNLIRECVERVNRDLAADPVLCNAQIHRFLILHKELDADDGELTRTQKVRRSFIADRYAPFVAALYDGSKQASISTEVTFEDGRKGTISARLKIRDAKTIPAEPAMEKAA